MVSIMPEYVDPETGIIYRVSILTGEMLPRVTARGLDFDPPHSDQGEPWPGAEEWHRLPRSVSRGT